MYENPSPFFKMFVIKTEEGDLEPNPRYGPLILWRTMWEIVQREMISRC
jgi:hypothetical protein